MSASPLIQAVAAAEYRDRAAEWKRNDAKVAALVVEALGVIDPPRPTEAALADLAIFKAWCDGQGVRYFPAEPASLALFILEKAVLGIDRLTDILGHVLEMYDALGLANPAATAIVNAALEKVGDIEPPHSWPKEHKARFALMPLILKRFAAEHDKQRQRTISRALNEAAEARKKLESLEKQGNENEVAA